MRPKSGVYMKLRISTEPILGVRQQQQKRNIRRTRSISLIGYMQRKSTESEGHGFTCFSRLSVYVQPIDAPQAKSWALTIKTELDSWVLVISGIVSLKLYHRFQLLNNG